MAKVLIVDDAEMNAAVLAEIVKMLGPETEIASNGKEAVDLVRIKAFDLIFMDHLMPVMDGMEAFSIIKKEKLCPGVPVIMVTANDSGTDSTMYLEAGFSDYMKKPFSAKIVKNILEKYKIINVNEEDETWKDLQHQLKELNLKAPKKYFLFDPSFFLEVLDEFEKNEYSVLSYGEPDSFDIEKYLCVVRAAKDAARLIGAEELAGEALLMEKDIKSDDDEAFAHHLENYRQLEKKLRKALRKAQNLKNSNS